MSSGDNIEWAEVGNAASLYPLPVPGDYPSLYQELLSKCNPSRFSGINYNHDKVQWAIEFTEKVKMAKDQPSGLKLLRDEAIEHGIHFSTVALFNKLTKYLKPSRFLEGGAYADSFGYNSDTARLANDLYQQVLEKADDIVALEMLCRKAQNAGLFRSSSADTNEQLWFSIMYFCIAILASFFLVLIIIK